MNDTLFLGSPSSRKQPSTPNSILRLNSKSLPNDTEVAILRYLSTHQRFCSFRDICNDNRVIFGVSGSEYRSKVRNRKNYLKRLRDTDPTAFIDILRQRQLPKLAKEVETIGFKGDEDDEDDEDDDEEDEDNENVPPATPTTMTSRSKILSGFSKFCCLSTNCYNTKNDDSPPATLCSFQIKILSMNSI
jgi:hypothetical protein